MNTNCLRGMRCPSCGSLGPFVITVLTTVLMSDDGSEEIGDLEYMGGSPCVCFVCGELGTVDTFSEEEAT